MFGIMKTATHDSFMEGKIEGKLEGKLEVVKNGIKQGLSIEIISQLTGIAREEIEKLALPKIVD